MFKHDLLSRYIFLDISIAPDWNGSFPAERLGNHGLQHTAHEQQPASPTANNHKQ